MNRTVTDKLICSTDTPHTAERSGSDWTVTWLPGRVLTQPGRGGNEHRRRTRDDSRMPAVEVA
jgi:hypothetical protein